MIFIFLPLCGIIHVIFTMYIFLRIFDKREFRENMYSAKISTFTVYIFIYIYIYIYIYVPLLICHYCLSRCHETRTYVLDFR